MFTKPTLIYLAIYTGRITEILDQGIMLQLHDQMAPVLLHNSHLSAKKIRHPSVLGLKVGEDLQVNLFAFSKEFKIFLILEYVV